MGCSCFVFAETTDPKQLLSRCSRPVGASCGDLAGWFHMAVWKQLEDVLLRGLFVKTMFLEQIIHHMLTKRISPCLFMTAICSVNVSSMEVRNSNEIFMFFGDQ